jgi:hypothetical protein
MITSSQTSVPMNLKHGGRRWALHCRECESPALSLYQ